MLTIEDHIISVEIDMMRKYPNPNKYLKIKLKFANGTEFAYFGTKEDYDSIANQLSRGQPMKLTVEPKTD